MNFQSPLSKALIKWLKLVDCLPQCYTKITQFADGVAFAVILAKSSSEYFGDLLKVVIISQIKFVNQNQQAPDDNLQTSLQRLKQCFEKLSFYFEINQGMHIPKINLLSLARDKNEQLVFELLGWVCKVILMSDAKDEFISPILEMDAEDQEIISEYFSQLFNQPNQMSPQQITPTNRHEQMLLKIEELEQEVHLLNQKLSSTLDDLSKSNQQVDILNQELKDKNAQIVMMTNLHIQNTNYEAELNKRSEFEIYKKQIHQMQREMQQLSDHNQQLLDRISQLEQYKSEADSLKKRLTASQKFESKVEAMKDSHSQQLAKFQMEIDERNAAITKLQEKNKELFDNFQKEKDRGLTLEFQIQRLQSQEIEHLEKNKYLERELSDAKTRLRGKKMSTGVAMNQSNEYSFNMDTSQSRSESISIFPSQTLGQDLSEVVNHISQMQKNQAEPQQQYNWAQVDENHKKELEIKQQRILQLEQQIKIMESANRSLEQSNKSQITRGLLLEQKIKQLQARNSISQPVDQSNSKLQEQNERLTMIVQDFKSKYQNLREEYAKLFLMLKGEESKSQ